MYNLIYKYGKAEVWLCEFKEDLFCYNIDSNSIVDNKNFIMKDLHLYPKSALPIDKSEKNLTFDLDKVINDASILISGRLIHDAQIKLRLYYDTDIIYEKEIEQFENMTFINFDKLLFDTAELVISRGNISDSVIIQNIYIVGKIEP